MSLRSKGGVSLEFTLSGARTGFFPACTPVFCGDRRCDRRTRGGHPDRTGKLHRRRSPYLVDRRASCLRQSAAKHLSAGQKLIINITDIDMAGGYESWHRPQFSGVRILRDVYPHASTLRTRRSAPTAM
ncbi:MAG: DUF3016 domain-containing protein [Gammaproteobacteria bacterium]|nr:DUF3016 domain-containing protein [Gammaproteobacteria bacterium]